MNKITAFIKSHPMETGLIALIGGILFLIILRRNSSSAASPASNVGALTLQEQQLQAATALQESQVQAQQNAQAYSAQVANTQTNAALNAQNFQTGADLISTLAQTKAQLAGLNVVTNAQNQVNQEQAAIATDYLNTQGALYSQGLAANQNTINSILSRLSTVHNSALQAGVLETVLGNYNAGVASQTGVAAQGISGNNLISSIFQGSSNVLTKLFG